MERTTRDRYQHRDRDWPAELAKTRTSIGNGLELFGCQRPFDPGMCNTLTDITLRLGLAQNCEALIEDSATIPEENVLWRSRGPAFLRRRVTFEEFQQVTPAKGAFQVTSEMKYLIFQLVTRLVRSEGGEDVSNFNGLPWWAKE
jgi:hypothetical protein